MSDKLELKMDTFDCILNGERIELTLQESQVLRLLANNPGRVVPFSAFVREIWDGPTDNAYLHNLHSIIARVRTKVGGKVTDKIPRMEFIRLRRDMGYQLSDKVNVSWVGDLNLSPPSIGPILRTRTAFKFTALN